MKTAAFALLLAWPAALLAQNAPQPPCAIAPNPFYADMGKEPRFRVWRNTGMATWTPPPCTGWSNASSNLLLAMAGSFSHSGSTDELLKRFGAVSTLRGIRYWSVTDKEWRVLVTDAAALSDAGSKDYRADFSALEMKSGRTLHFAQRDTRSTSQVVYRMRVRESSAERIVLELENVTSVRAAIVTLFSPGDMKFLYFLERRATGNWGAYALVSANGSYAEGNEASVINRAAAFYRHFTGVPTDGAPPLRR